MAMARPTPDGHGRLIRERDGPPPDAWPARAKISEESPGSAGQDAGQYPGGATL